jgi:hypothetical protein
MCTVSILPHPEGPSSPVWSGHEAPILAREPWRVRIVCNRDERPTRPKAVPPAQHAVGSRQALMPIDPTAGGTWVAVNDAGLFVTLLNASDRLAQPGQARRSRGEVIPALLEADTLDRAVAAVMALSPANYLPFRLVLVAAGEVHVLKSNGARWTTSDRSPLTTPVMFASSGLGDELVTAPRAELFARMFAEPPESPSDWAERQDAFHVHAWPDRRHLSVLMLRDEARTVSLTTVEIGGERATMDYRPIEMESAVLESVVRRSLPLALPGV